MAKRMQKSSKEFRNSITPPPQQYCPAVSVIIPMYNAERYIGEALDSILAQTFQNFEVVVVNNCSTDNSATVVESYKEKFGGRLTLLHMEYNTGNGGLPRNKGMTFSRGEYIFCMDADDMLTETALEELYTLAKEYDADVVYCERNYSCDADGSNLQITTNQKGNFVDKPTFETEDMRERINKQIVVMQWTKFVRRSLIFEHEIFFPWCAVSEDDIWTYGLVFYAKKFLRVPNIVYIYRASLESVTRKKKTSQETINFWSSPVIFGLKTLDKFMSKHEFFQQNPQYRYTILENFASIILGCFLSESFQLPSFVVYETIKQGFGDKLGDYDVLVSALCTLVNTQQKMAAIHQQRFNQFAAQAQEQVKKFNEFAAQAQARIAELEAQLKTK